MKEQAERTTGVARNLPLSWAVRAALRHVWRVLGGIRFAAPSPDSGEVPSGAAEAVREEASPLGGRTLDDIPAVIALLEETVRLSGDEFLRLGAALMEAGERVRFIMGAAERLAGLAGGEDFGRGVQSLRSVMESAAAMDKRAGACEEALEELSARLLECRAPAHHFHRGVRMFRILSVLTRIETARLERSREEMLALGGQVETLASQVQQETEGIEELCRQLAALSAGSSRQFAASRRERCNELGEILAWGHRAVNHLESFRAQAAEGAAALHGRYQAMSSRIRTLVCSLQFQDITRQRIEHACQALAKLDARQEDRAGALPAPHRARLALLQVEQLRKTRTSLAGAIDQVLGAMEELASEAGGLARDLAGIEGSQREGQSRPVQEVEEATARLAAPLEAYWAYGEKLQGALGELLPGIEQVRNHMRTIDQIRFSMTLVALNAAIKTAHLEGQGAAMAVLATAVHATTQDTSGDSEAIASRLLSVAATAGRLSTGCEEESSGPAGAGLDTGAQGCARHDSRCLELRVRGLRETDTEMLDLARQSGEKAALLSAAFSAALAQCPPRLTLLGGLDAAIEAVAASASVWMATAGESGAGAGADGEFDEAAVAYTMQSERDVHNLFRGVVGGESRPGEDGAAAEQDGEDAAALQVEALVADGGMAEASEPGAVMCLARDSHQIESAIPQESTEGNADFGENVELF